MGNNIYLRLINFKFPLQCSIILYKFILSSTFYFTCFLIYVISCKTMILKGNKRYVPMLLLNIISSASPRLEKRHLKIISGTITS